METNRRCRFWFLENSYLTGSNEHAVRHLTAKVLHALDNTIVLAIGFAELDTDPLARGELSSATKANNCAPSGYLDYRSDSDVHDGWSAPDKK